MEESDEALARYGEGTGGFKRFAVCDCDLDDYAEEGRFYIYNNVFYFIYLYSGGGDPCVPAATPRICL